MNSDRIKTRSRIIDDCLVQGDYNEYCEYLLAIEAINEVFPIAADSIVTQWEYPDVLPYMQQLKKEAERLDDYVVVDALTVLIDMHQRALGCATLGSQ